jgi:hypothetical protein
MNMCTEHSSICVSSDANDGEPIPLRELIRTLVNTVTTCACTDEGLGEYASAACCPNHLQPMGVLLYWSWCAHVDDHYDILSTRV